MVSVIRDLLPDRDRPIECRAFPMAYGILLMTLALHEASRVWKEVHGFKGMKLIKVLVIDQALYFLM